MESKRGHLEEAVDLHREAVRIKRASLGERHPGVAQSLYNMGVLEMKRGRLQAAKACGDEALAIRQEALGPQHASSLAVEVLLRDIVQVARSRLCKRSSAVAG